MVKEYKINDNGKRKSYISGLVRENKENKPFFELLIPEGIPYNETMLYRWAMVLKHGAEKYDLRNWELANTKEDLERFKGSAFRHFMQAMCGEDDEDHIAAVFFNLNAYETIKYKMKQNGERS